MNACALVSQSTNAHPLHLPCTTRVQYVTYAGKDSGQDVAAVKALVAQQTGGAVSIRKRLPALPSSRQAGDADGDVEEEEEEEDELSQIPEFQLTFGDDGTVRQRHKLCCCRHGQNGHTCAQCHAPYSCSSLDARLCT